MLHGAEGFWFSRSNRPATYASALCCVTRWACCTETCAHYIHSGDKGYSVVSRTKRDQRDMSRCNIICQSTQTGATSLLFDPSTGAMTLSVSLPIANFPRQSPAPCAIAPLISSPSIRVLRNKAAPTPARSTRSRGKNLECI